MQEVHVEAAPLQQLSTMLSAAQDRRLHEVAERAQRALDGRTVWNVNATATGGGVAEMLMSLVAYGRGAGVDTRWLVLDGTPSFFRFTKRLHNQLHGSPGDGGSLDDSQRGAYEEVLKDNLRALRPLVQPGDIVLLHDPQTAGLARGLVDAGIHVLWRCHIGSDTTNDHTRAAWSFLEPYLRDAHALVFSRPSYAPAWVTPDRLEVIAPSLDPLTAKNEALSETQVTAALENAGILNGSGAAVPRSARVVLQVSRWDRLKDMSGVLTGFVEQLPHLPDDVHLVLAGPDVRGVSDDPEGAEVLQECLTTWRAQPPATRARVHVCNLPMGDVKANAHLVNALQRFATVVVQKSLAEGFGLTVTEPMWKARPVIGSRVGGIQDQIEDGRSGVLLDDPRDLHAFGTKLTELLTDPAREARLGDAARERVREHFLPDRHLAQYVDLFMRLIAD